MTNISVSTFCAYAAFAMVSWCIYDWVADRSWSSTITLSGYAHCFGLLLMSTQVISTGSAASVSARALVLDGFAVCFRLSSTLFFEGYLPNDKSGDHAYQCADVCSLLLIAFLLRCMLVTHRSTYQENDDDMSIVPLILVCLILAAILHGDMDDNAVFDTLWLAGQFVSAVAILPQYWLISRSSGNTQVLIAHYIAASGIDRLLSGFFMWHVRRHITCELWVTDVQHTICAILFAHVLHLVLLSDFAFFYARAFIGSSISSDESSGKSMALIPEGYMV
jgi:hypothetical protein